MKNQNKKMTTPSVTDTGRGRAWQGLLASIFLAVCVVSLMSGCSKKAEPPKVMPAAPVTVDTASKRSVPMQLHAIGNVEPNTTVGIKAQIGGAPFQGAFHRRAGRAEGEPAFYYRPPAF